jgi:cystathionine beta-lyase
MTELHADPMALLRTRTSSKWRAYRPEITPLWVAEMDYPLATPIAATLIDLIGRSDTGYDPRPAAYGEAFSEFATDAWGWTPDPARVLGTTDVSTAIVETVRQVAPGGRVVVTSPVYPPFFTTIVEGGAEVVDVPLVSDGASQWRLDLDGIEAALADGALAVLLCHPHNPIGHIHPREQLEALAELAAAHGAVVISDEVHAPLTHSDAEFVPFVTVSPAAADVGITISSASKAWNIAGLKSAFIVTDAGTRAAERIAGMPAAVQHRLSHFGVHASIAAFRSSRAWLASAVEAIEGNRHRLRALLDEHLPEAIMHEPKAGYLVWIDLTALGWGDDPAARILAGAKIAVNHGPAFGPAGAGHIRLNIACSPETLEDAVLRIAALR